MKPRIVAFIPARKSSKSITKKNIRLFNGKPLIFWTLDLLVGLNYVDEIWVATDCDETVKQIESHYRDIKIFIRSCENAMDRSPTIDVVLEFLYSHNYLSNTNFLLCQATSPFTTREEIKEAINKIESGAYDSVISCLRLKKFVWSESGQPLNYKLGNKPRRQDFNGFLVESGNFYLSRTETILKTKDLISGKIGITEVGSNNQIELDEPLDWVIGEAIMQYIEKQNFVKRPV